MPTRHTARLAREHLYEDKTSLTFEEVSLDEAITPARVREIHREQLAKSEERRAVLGLPTRIVALKRTAPLGCERQ